MLNSGTVPGSTQLLRRLLGDGAHMTAGCRAVRSWWLAMLFGLTLSLQAGTEVRTFPSPELEQRYYKLLEELRCLVCQNQSLLDSNADLAEDLRDEVYRMLLQGKREEEIVRFLTERYGDFVLYRPPFKGTTLLLWLGPILGLGLGGLLFWRFIQRHRLP